MSNKLPGRALRPLFMFLLLAAGLVAQLGTVRVVNRTPYRHRNLAICGVTFPPGAVLATPDGQATVLRTGEPLGVPAALHSAVQPFGARWPQDGSVRFGRLFAVLEADANSDRELPLGAIAPKPYALSPWMIAKAGSVRPAVVLTRKDDTVQVSEISTGVRSELLAANAAALVVRYRQRIAGSPLFWEITFAFGSDTDAIQCWLWIGNSDPSVPDVKYEYKSIELRTAMAATIYWRERLGIPDASPVTTNVDPGYIGTSWRVCGQDWLGDAQGLNWFEGVIPVIDVANLNVPNVRQRSEAQQAVFTGPLEMMHSGWSTPGLYGPLGSCGELPEGMTLASADALITAEANAWQSSRQPLGTWAELRFGEYADTARTGEHPTHGVCKLADLCLTKNPRGIIERRFAWLGETRRPNCRFETNLAPVTAARHPQWIAWSGSTHYRVSPDKLGKPIGPDDIAVHNWFGPDPEHWMGETYLGPLALITADWRLLELGRHRMENLKAHGYGPLQNYAARSICWVSRAAAWWSLALGDSGDLAWTRGWQDFVIAQHTQKWAGKNGPVKPWVTMFDPRYFASPEREFWIIWQHNFLFGWLEAARVTGHAGALSMAKNLSRMVELEGWHPTSNHPFGGQALQPDAQPLTLAQKDQYVLDRQDPMGNWYKTDGQVTSDAQTDWFLWGIGELDIGKQFAQEANDAAWSARNAILRNAIRATLTDPTRRAKAAAWSGATPVDPVPIQ